MQADPLLHVAGALVLFSVFAGAAWHKWRAAGEFQATLAEYRLLPPFAVTIAARCIPVLEAAAAAALLLPAVSRSAAVLAGVLLAAYTLAIGINLARGRRHIDCGCGWPGQQQTLSAWLLLRNGVLLVLAWICSLPVQARPLSWADWSIAVPAALAGGLFYLAANQLLANRDRLAHLHRTHG